MLQDNNNDEEENLYVRVSDSPNSEIDRLANDIRNLSFFSTPIIGQPIVDKKLEISQRRKQRKIEKKNFNDFLETLTKNEYECNELRILYENFFKTNIKPNSFGNLNVIKQNFNKKRTHKSKGLVLTTYTKILNMDLE